MRKRSILGGVFVLTAVFGVFGCAGDDPAAATPNKSEGAPREEGTAPGSTADGGPSVDPGPAPDPDAGSPPADAAPTEAAHILGYVFSSSPAADESTPSAQYAYNASGGAMKITRTNTGQYTVTFTGLGLDSSVAFASAYDTQGGLCHWGGTTGEEVKVRCLNAAGNNTDAKFVLTVVGKGTTGATILGFAHANDKSSASYTPQASRSNNAVGGGAITASRVATGTYKMEFGGLALLDIGNVQVMPYGDESAHCVVKSWSLSTVNVYCYDGAGTLADAQYTIMIAGTKPGGTAQVVAYAQANESTSASYTPPLSYNQGDGAVTATRSAAGTYSIAFDGKDLNSGAHVQVSAHSQGRRCNVNDWVGSTVNLTCANSAGTKSDNSYAIVVLQ
jgi:hypothetical protein